MHNLVMAVALWPVILLLILGCSSLKALDEKRVWEMLNLERGLLQNLRDYAEKMEEKISLINNSLEEYIDDIEEANRNPEMYLSNPLNSFRLIRHMHQDWVGWQVYMEEPVAPDAVEKLERLLPQLPHKEAFRNAAREVHSLTQFYGYEPADLVAKNERNSSLHLSPLDCYHLGLELYEDQDYRGAAKWLQVAAHNYTISRRRDLYDLLGAPRWQVYRDLGRALHKLNRPSAFDAYESALRLDSQNVHLMKEAGQMELFGLRDPMEPILDLEPTPTVLDKYCRGEVPRIQGRLTCELNDWVHPFLVYAPIKYEDLQQDPFTILYPGSIYEQEIRHVENAYERCPPNARFDLKQGITGCSISDGYSPVLKRINERILDMAGEEHTWETFYIVEHSQLTPFEPFKLFRNSTKFPKLNLLNFEDVEAKVIIFVSGTTNLCFSRSSTFSSICQLKDVTLGGSFTMPKGVLVQPKRGNVLITFGNKEHSTSICPIIEGTGLVMIKFIMKKDE